MPASYANESPAYQSGSDESVIKKNKLDSVTFRWRLFFISYFKFNSQAAPPTWAFASTQSGHLFSGGLDQVLIRRASIMAAVTVNLRQTNANQANAWQMSEPFLHSKQKKKNRIIFLDVSRLLANRWRPVFFLIFISFHRVSFFFRFFSFFLASSGLTQVSTHYSGPVPPFSPFCSAAVVLLF